MHSLAVALLIVIIVRPGAAQEAPYFITEHHHLPEAGALGLANYSVAGIPKQGHGFLGSDMEFEYRAIKWWATTLELHGQSTLGESTIFTGYAWSNKFKLAPAGQFFVNPVLVVTWEDASAADKSVAEIEGHSSLEDFATPNGVARRDREHEIETRLILSRDHRGWNFAGNVLTAKNLSGEPWQFGYSLGVSRPLSTAKSDKSCSACRRAFSAGMEFYGGLGDSDQFGLDRTSHYLGPALSWELTSGVAFKVAPNFGLTRESQRAFIHFAVIYDIPDFNKRVREWFH
jgi:hypothetical protein